MNESTEEKQPTAVGSELKPAPAERLLPASKAHQLLALIGTTFIFFEIIFVELYSDNFWFSLDISWIGIPAVLVCAVLAHFFLKFIESDRVCRWLYFLWKGKPVLIYSRWTELDSTGFSYGIRHVQWNAVDELFLTFFGNLEIRSYSLSGDNNGLPDPLFKFPFSAASQEDQLAFLNAAQAGRPGLKFNQRLEKRIHSPLIRGQNAIQLGGAAFMAVILLDVGYSSLVYLDMLKHYHLARTHGIAGDAAAGRTELAKADSIREHPLPISYVTSRFLHVGTSGAGVMQARANALWDMGDPESALKDTDKAIEMSPDNFRIHLLRARILTALHREDDAKAAIETAIDKHKNSLMPRLYLVVNARRKNQTEAVTAYDQTMEALKESTFGEEPVWPPGGNRFVHDVFYSDDIYFIFDPLLNVERNKKRVGEKSTDGANQ